MVTWAGMSGSGGGGQCTVCDCLSALPVFPAQFQNGQLVKQKRILNGALFFVGLRFVVVYECGWVVLNLGR